MVDPGVTFFFFSGDGERGGAGGLPGAVGGPAGVAPRVLAERVHDDERGGVRGLFEVKDHVCGGLDGLLLMKPLYVWFGHAGHAGVEARHLPVRDRAAPDWLNENGLLAEGGLLYTGQADSDGPLRRRLADRLS